MPTNLLLSEHDLLVVSEREFFFVKKQVTQKIYNALAQVVSEVREEKIFNGVSAPKETDLTTGKISKGENYLGLPYILLDYPRHFHPEQLFAVRTMLWWGNFLSSTLLFGKNIFPRALDKIILAQAHLKQSEFFLGISDSPWHHHFEEDNYRAFSSFNNKELKDELKRKSFVKLSRKIPVSEANRLIGFTKETMKQYAGLLS